MKRFGEIIKVKIPQEELRNGKFRSRGFAFVTFKKEESAARALEQREVTVEFATLEIERALKKTAPPKEGSKFPSEFEQLKRR
jgi:RNA recognition motif-containing protein